MTSTRSTDACIVFMPARPPCPELRADVIDDRDAEPPHAGHQPEVEVGKIDRTKTSGRRARAAAISRRSISTERGMTRSDSIRPVTENP